MIILVEKNVQGFLWICAKRTSIYSQNYKVTNSERYWTLLTKENLSGVIQMYLLSATSLLLQFLTERQSLKGHS